MPAHRANPNPNPNPNPTLTLTLTLTLTRRVHQESAHGAAERSLLLTIPIHLLGRFLRAAPHLRPHVTLLRAEGADAGLEEYADSTPLQRGVHLHNEMQDAFQDCPWTTFIALSPTAGSRAARTVPAQRPRSAQ